MEGQDVVNYLLKAQKDLSRVREKMLNHEIILMVGIQGCGKSSMINFIIDTPLVAVEEEHPFYTIEKQEESDDGPPIGTGKGLPTTRIPGIYKFGVDRLLIDFPPFHKDQGVEQEIINALYLNQITRAQNITVILVAEIDDLLYNVENLVSLIEKTHRLIPNLDDMFAGITITFTKVHQAFNSFHLADILKGNVMDNENLNFNKSLVERMINNPHLIGMFSMPISPGFIDDELRENTSEGRFHLPYFELFENAFQLRLSEAADLSLQSLYKKYIHTDCSYFEVQLERVIESITSKYRKKSYVSNKAIRNIKNKLKCLHSKYLMEQGTHIRKISQIRSFFDKFKRDYVHKEELDLLVNLDDALLIEYSTKVRLTERYDISLLSACSTIVQIITVLDQELKTRLNRT